MSAEPEITIRKLYKCCAAGDCSGCTTMAAIQFANFLGSTMLGTPPTPSANHQQPTAITNTTTTTTSTSQPSTPSSSSSNLITNTNLPKKKPNQFNCTNCSFSCSWRYDLKLHLRQKHGIKNKKL